MTKMTTFFTALSLFIIPAAAQGMTIDYQFKNPEECSNQNHQEYTDLMMTNQGKLAEVIEGAKDIVTFHKAWAEAANAQWQEGDSPTVGTMFIFKSYPQAGLIFAYNDGCLVGARVFPLDFVNKILEIYYTKKKSGDL